MFVDILISNVFNLNKHFFIAVGFYFVNKLTLQIGLQIGPKKFMTAIENCITSCLIFSTLVFIEHWLAMSDVRDGCCTRCVLYAMRAVLNAWCTRCVLYAMRAVLNACCTRCVLYSMRDVRNACCTQRVLYAMRAVRNACCTQCVLYAMRAVRYACWTRCVPYARTLRPPIDFDGSNYTNHIQWRFLVAIRNCIFI